MQTKEKKQQDIAYIPSMVGFISQYRMGEGQGSEPISSFEMTFIF